MNGASGENLKPRGFKSEKYAGFLFTRKRWTVPKVQQEAMQEMADVMGEHVAKIKPWQMLVLQHSDSNTPLSWYNARQVAMVLMREGAWDNVEPEHLEAEPYEGGCYKDGVPVAWVRWLGRDDAGDPMGKRMEFFSESGLLRFGHGWRRL